MLKMDFNTQAQWTRRKSRSILSKTTTKNHFLYWQNIVPAIQDTENQVQFPSVRETWVIFAEPYQWATLVTRFTRPGKAEARVELVNMPGMGDNLKSRCNNEISKNIEMHNEFMIIKRLWKKHTWAGRAGILQGPTDEMIFLLQLYEEGTVSVLDLTYVLYLKLSAQLQPENPDREINDSRKEREHLS